MPTTTGKATDFITFSRASNATVTDADGKIKWAPHNLLTNSESFDNAAWLKNHITSTNPTVVANDGVAPNGTTTADKVGFGVIDAAGDVSSIVQSFTADTASYTGGVWIKASTAGDVGKTVSVYLNDGTLKGQIFVTVTADWQYVTTSAALASGAGRTFHVSTVGSTYGGANQAAVSVYLWGAHLYRSDLGGMQANTSAYPMYNPTTPKNLLGYSESLDTGWAGTSGGLQASGVELVTNGTFDTDTTGWSVTDDETLSVVSGRLRITYGANGSRGYAYQQVSGLVVGKKYSLKLSARYKGTNGAVGLRVTNSLGLGAGLLEFYSFSDATNETGYFTATATSVYVNLYGGYGTAGTYVEFDGISLQELLVYEAPNGLQTARAVEATAANATLLSSISLLASPYTFSVWLKRKTGSGNVQLTVDGSTYTTVSVTDTWTRFSTTLTPSAGTKTPGIRLVTSGDAVYAWGAQLSDSASLDAYVPSYGAAVTSAAYYGPRRDFDPVTLGCKGLLVEEQRTNLLLHTTAFDNAAWASGYTQNASVTANAVIAPDGTLSADTIAATGNTCRITQAVTYTANIAYTFSVWIKRKTGTGAITIGPNVENGSVATVSVTSEWTRVSVTGTPRTTNGTGYATIQLGVSGDEVYVWGAQVEAGSFATSYIPTGAATATRNADVASVSTQAFPYGDATGSLVVSGTRFGGTGYGPFACLRNSADLNNRNPDMSIGSGPGGAGGISRVDVIAAGASQAAIGEFGTFVSGTLYKVGYGYATNDFVSVVNAGTPNADTSGTVPTTVNTMDIGHRNSSAQLNGHIRQITYLPRRISNAELQTRTA